MVDKCVPSSPPHAALGMAHPKVTLCGVVMRWAAPLFVWGQRLMPATSDGPLARHGAVWITMLGMAAGGIYWLAALFEKVENQQVQIASLQGVANRRGAMDAIGNIQEDIVRLERGHDRLHEELDKRGMEREDYKEAIARMAEREDGG